jgi:hypothetical protein
MTTTGIQSKDLNSGAIAVLYTNDNRGTPILYQNLIDPKVRQEFRNTATRLQGAPRGTFWLVARWI